MKYPKANNELEIAIQELIEQTIREYEEVYNGDIVAEVLQDAGKMLFAIAETYAREHLVECDRCKSEFDGDIYTVEGGNTFVCENCLTQDELENYENQ